MTTRHKLWTYAVRTFGDAPEDSLSYSLNAMGKQGWELVAFDFVRMRAVFKRPTDPEPGKERAHAD